MIWGKTARTRREERVGTSRRKGIMEFMIDALLTVLGLVVTVALALIVWRGMTKRRRWP